VSADVLSTEPHTPPVGTSLLSLTGIQKRFGAVRALSDVDFEVRAGEVVALIGDNGAGKSTLVKVMSGAGPADEGSYRIEGREVSIGTPAAATTHGVATVFQDLAICDNLDVVANLFLGRELTRGVALDEPEMERRTVELLEQLSVKLPSVRIPMASLSGGQRQSVAIVRALLGSPKVVLLDEPTAALGVAQTAQVLNLVERLRERGLGVVLISHNMADVMAVADRAVVLRLGRVAGRFDMADVSREQLVATITGADTNVVSERAARVAGRSAADHAGTEGNQA
jgi:D-xylose transport system ATP-binding protein